MKDFRSTKLLLLLKNWWDNLFTLKSMEYQPTSKELEVITDTESAS